MDGSSGLPAVCYYVKRITRYKVGMALHLAGTLFSSLLATFQFVPGIRRRFITYHRIAGYAAILLMFVGNTGALMLADKAAGGHLITQEMVGFVVLVTTITFGLAVWNVKKLQLDQHRAWMLRTWSYLAFIISLRLIEVIIAAITSKWPGAERYAAMTCDQLEFIYTTTSNITATREVLYSEYPVCAPENIGLLGEGAHIAVKGVLGDERSLLSAVMIVAFPAGAGLALLLHAIVVEVYLGLTPAEAERLRNVSYRLQLERGYKNPGSAGLVVQKFGDANPWIPSEEVVTTPGADGSSSDGGEEREKSSQKSGEQSA